MMAWFHRAMGHGVPFRVFLLRLGRAASAMMTRVALVVAGVEVLRGDGGLVVFLMRILRLDRVGPGDQVLVLLCLFLHGFIGGICEGHRLVNDGEN